MVVTTCPCRCLHLKAAASRAITQTTPLHPLINPPPSTPVATPTLGNTKGHHSHPRTPTHPPSHPKGARLILPHLTYQLVSKTKEARKKSSGTFLLKCVFLCILCPWLYTSKWFSFYYFLESLPEFITEPLPECFYFVFCIVLYFGVLSFSCYLHLSFARNFILSDVV